MRVAVVFPGADLAGFPGARNLVVGLAERGFDVSLVLLRRQVVPLGDLAPRVEVVSLAGPTGGSRRVAGMPSLLPLAHRVCAWLLKNVHSLDVVIGVDRPGLVLGWLGTRGSRSQLVSFLVEFYLPPKWSGAWNRVADWLEGVAYRRCDINLVQDERRAAFLCQRHGLDPRRAFRLPNSPFGAASPERTSFVHDRFGVPRGQVVILQAGVLDLGTRFEEVMAAAREFPESWTMVFQSSRPLQLPTEFEQLKAPRTIVNPVPLRYEEVEPLVRSATVGVALYRVLSPNTLLKGAAAGKLAMYLKCGVPVVAQDLPSFVHLVEGYGCGVLVHDTSELGSAVERILAEYERFRAGALACFAAEFALDPHLDRLAGLLKSHA